MIRLRQLFFVLCGMMAMVSCDSSTDDDVRISASEYEAKDCFNYVNDNGTESLQPGAYYGFVFDYVSATYSIVVKGLSDGNTLYPDFVAEGIKWSYSGPWKSSHATNVRAKTIDGSVMPAIMELNIHVLDRVTNGKLDPVYQIDMTFDNGVTFVTYPVQMNYYGTTTVSAQGVKEFKTKESTYVLTIDRQTRKATVNVNNARFAENMPVGMNMVFKDIDFTVTKKTIELESASLIPEIGGDPYPAFAISQLAGSFGLSDGMSFDFHCAAKGSDYSVNVKAKVLPQLMEE